MRASRFGLLDIRERFFKTVLAAKANVDKAFINLKFVLEESNLQLFSPKAAAQSFDCDTGAAVASVGCIFIAHRTLHFAHQKFGLIEQSGRVKIR